MRRIVRLIVCLDCGCHNWPNEHGDPRHITSTAIMNAVTANPGMTIQDVCANIYDGLVAIFNQSIEGGS